MAASDDSVDLLLAYADERSPVLEEGLPAETAQRGTKPKEKDTFGRRRDDDDPNDLGLQRWGVIAPEGSSGDRLLEAITPLLKLREEEQRAPVIRYRVPKDMDAKKSVVWRNDTYWSEDVDEDDRPMYLLLLGDPSQVSLELQHALANSALPGRVHFSKPAGGADLDGYEAYAKKVVRFAREGTPEPKPDLVFFVANDGTSATIQGKAKLLNPSLDDANIKLAAGKLPAASVRELEAGTVDALLAGGAGTRPSVLLSVSHGVGAPRRGWPSLEEQWQRQGALVIGDNELLDAERLRGQAFLPGGLWFCLACFGAGTPAKSAYQAWLEVLSTEGAYKGKVSSVLASLPVPGEDPFIAAMPQAALRNPEGPLGVIGHMDLAWTYSFSSAGSPSNSRISRINEVLLRMVRGSRAGMALDGLLRSYRETNDMLMQGYQLAADARVNKRPDPTDYKEYGHLWMLRNDLRGYVLLGDPAAHLPLMKNALGASPPSAQLSGPGAFAAPISDPYAVVAPTAPTAPTAPILPAAVAASNVRQDERKDAVLSVLRGESRTEIAAWYGVSLSELKCWVDTFVSAGSDALAELGRS